MTPHNSFLEPIESTIKTIIECQTTDTFNSTSKSLKRTMDQSGKRVFQYLPNHILSIIQSRTRPLFLTPTTTRCANILFELVDWHALLGDYMRISLYLHFQCSLVLHEITISKQLSRLLDISRNIQLKETRLICLPSCVTFYLAKLFPILTTSMISSQRL